MTKITSGVWRTSWPADEPPKSKFARARRRRLWAGRLTWQVSRFPGSASLIVATLVPLAVLAASEWMVVRFFLSIFSDRNDPAILRIGTAVILGSMILSGALTLLWHLSGTSRLVALGDPTDYLPIGSMVE